MRIGAGLIFFSLLAGSLLCLNDRFQPFRLRSLQVENFSPALEAGIRDWGDSFMSFHPSWLLAKSDLLSVEERYPLTIETSWKPFSGTLKLTATPISPVIKLNWQYGEYLVSESGKAWPVELWEESIDEDVPDVPEMSVGSSFPLLTDPSQERACDLKVPLDWLTSLYKTLTGQSGIDVLRLELTRRAGADAVDCVFEDKSKKCRVSFIGNVSGLDKSLVVVRELINTHAGENISLDATYEDKIVVKKEQSIVK